MSYFHHNYLFPSKITLFYTIIFRLITNLLTNLFPCKTSLRIAAQRVEHRLQAITGVSVVWCQVRCQYLSKMKMADGTTNLRRNRPGTKAKDFCRWPDEPLDEMDSTLVVQQYIQQLIRRDPTNIDLILKMPESQDEGVWKYEHLRQFCMELNGLAVRLQAECHPETCTQMTATEQWIFLCAAHKTPKECPAIDYTRHTLDGAACLLNSNKYFPSRVSIKESSVAKLGSVCRRVYRIFSHAYFHHRSIFDEFENETCLCKRFTQFVTRYNLMSKDNLIVPILDEDAAPGGESEA